MRRLLACLMCGNNDNERHVLLNSTDTDLIITDSKGVMFHGICHVTCILWFVFFDMVV